MAAAKRPVAKKPAAKRAPARKRVVTKVAAKRRAAQKSAAKKPSAKRAAPARRAATPPPARRQKYVAKTQPTAQSVGTFLAGIADAAKRADAEEIARMLGEITGVEAKMWGPSIVGFGQYHYRYESGHEGDACIAGFSPRKDALTLYVMPGFEQWADLMAKLGKYRTGKSCLYLKRLDDVDRDVLRELMARSVAVMAPKRTA